jgi:hypothetical protein
LVRHGSVGSLAIAVVNLCGLPTAHQAQSTSNPILDFVPEQFGRKAAFLAEAAAVVVGQAGKTVGQIRFAKIL